MIPGIYLYTSTKQQQCTLKYILPGARYWYEERFYIFYDTRSYTRYSTWYILLLLYARTNKHDFCIPWYKIGSDILTPVCRLLASSLHLAACQQNCVYARVGEF